MRESLAGMAGYARQESNESISESDLDFEQDAGLERDAALDLTEEGKQLRKRVSIAKKVRIADKLQRANDLDFLNYLQTKAITPPSLEFLADFNNFISIMQAGIIFIEAPHLKKKKTMVGSKSKTKLVVKK